MLKKNNRLNLSVAENALIFHNRDKDFYKTEFFLVYRRSNIEQLKLNCVVPKRLAKTAILRNFYRRLLFQIFEEISFGEEKAQILNKKEDLVFVYKLIPNNNLREKKQIQDRIKTDLEKFFKKIW